MSELAQGFLIGVVLALAGGALALYLHRVNSPPQPPEEREAPATDDDRTRRQERRR